MAKLIFSLNPSDSLDFPLNTDVIRMGRHPGNDIVINNSWISSNHAEFRREQGQLVLRDLQSSNGTSVNGTPITGHILAHGDRIAFGQLEAVYDAEAVLAPAVASPSPQVRPGPVAKPMPAPVAKVFPTPSLAGTTPVKEPVKPAPAPVIVAKAMAPPAATIAYDTARKEMSAELEEIQKKTIEAQSLAGSARQARDAAKEELAKVKAALAEAQKEFGQWQESEEAARRASEAEHKNAAQAALKTAEEAKAALVRLNEQTLAAQQEMESVRAEKQSVHALLASTRAETERASAGLTGLRAELTALRETLAAGESGRAAERKETESLAAQLAAGRQALLTVQDELAAARQMAVSQKETVLAEAAALANRQASLLAETRVLEGRLENLRRETGGAAALNVKVADLRQQQAESERRLDILNDRLHGMSEAPDPNWGTVHSLARSFIKKLDLIDDLICHLANRPEAAETLEQLSIFRSGLLDILKEYSIEAYSLEPGTVIDVAARKRIQIVETLSEGSHDGTRIVRTYRPGYVCLNGDLAIPTLLRKADVAVSIAMS